MASITRGCQAAQFVKGFLLYWLAFAAGAQPRLPDWNELTLELSPALMVKADLKTIVAEQARPKLVELPGTLQPSGAVYHLTVETRLKWFLSSKTWLGELWIQPDLTALQRTRLKLGPSSNYKIYRYANQGVYRIRHQPKAENAAIQPPQTWPKAEHFYAFPKNSNRHCALVSDPYAVLLLLSQPGPIPERICAFNKQGLYQISFRHTGSEPVQVRYRQSAKPHRVRAQVQAERILIHPLPPESDAGDPEPFEFLGMEGDIVFLRDPKTYLPLRIEGEVPGFGQAKLQLTKVKLRR